MKETDEAVKVVPVDGHDADALEGGPEPKLAFAGPVDPVAKTVSRKREVPCLHEWTH